MNEREIIRQHIHPDCRINLEQEIKTLQDFEIKIILDDLTVMDHDFEIIDLSYITERQNRILTMKNRKTNEELTKFIL